MKTTCLINNFNYCQYLSEAIESALHQSVSYDEIIVVDDGSTDSSADLLLEKYSRHPQIKLIFKQNQGQLSCFNEGFLASTGDLIFFLDSDDLYNVNYLEEALNFYRKHPECDFLFCAYEKFGNAEGIVREYNYEYERSFGCSTIRTLYSKRWIGSVTSTVSMNRNTLNKILPLPLLEDWKTRADDCLVYGASLVGATKFSIPNPLVKYRIHSNNDSSGYSKLQSDSIYLYKRYLKIHRLFNLICAKNYHDSQIFELIDSEFNTIPSPSYEEFKQYFKIALAANIDFYNKLKKLYSIIKYFAKNHE